MSDPLLTARAVADLLGVSAETVLRWTRRGELPAIRLPGGAIRYREDVIDGWLAERATPVRGVVEHPAGRRPGASVHSISSSTPRSTEED
jgi:excisionase family DNA binding protein